MNKWDFQRMCLTQREVAGIISGQSFPLPTERWTRRQSLIPSFLSTCYSLTPMRSKSPTESQFVESIKAIKHSPELQWHGHVPEVEDHGDNDTVSSLWLVPNPLGWSYYTSQIMTKIKSVIFQSRLWFNLSLRRPSRPDQTRDPALIVNYCPFPLAQCQSPPPEICRRNSHTHSLCVGVFIFSGNCAS